MTTEKLATKDDLHNEIHRIEDQIHKLEVEMKNFSPTYRALEMYDVEKLYVEKESLEARGLTEEDLLVAVEVMTNSEIGKLMEQQDVVLSF